MGPRRSSLRRFGPHTFRGTIVVSTVALMAAAMIVVGLGLQVLLDRTAQRDISRVLEEQSEATVVVVQQASTDRLTVPAEALEPGTEVYDKDGDLVAGSVRPDANDLARDLSTARQATTVDGPDDELRLRATPFTTPSGESGVVVATAETAPYERSEFYALLATIVLGVLVVAATALVALRVTRQALAPVAQMAERAADWSEHDLTHRFDLGPPTNELAALGSTLDGLLDRVASAIRSEQRLTSELAHELRTPLTSIRGSADLALLRGVEDDEARRDLEQIAASARDMSAVIAALLDLAREGTAGFREQTCVVADLAPRLRSSVSQPTGLRLDLRLDASTARIAAPAELVLRVVGPLVDNAVRHARHGVRVEAHDRPGSVDLVVVDDGPGVPTALRATLFEPGVTSVDGGAGLGLGIARRVARSIGGEVTLDADADGGAFRVTLPRR